MSKLKFKIGDRVAIRDNVELYGGDIGTVVNIIPPGFKKSDGSTCTYTTYLVETTDGCCDEFYGNEMDHYHAANEKISVQEIELEMEANRLDEEEYVNAFADLEELDLATAKDDWNKFQKQTKKEWDKFLG